MLIESPFRVTSPRATTLPLIVIGIAVELPYCNVDKSRAVVSIACE